MITLSAQQGQAVKSIGEWYKDFEFEVSKPFFELTGYAGSGKTTILPHIVDELGILPDDIAFCSPTGKAAKVMTTKMKGMGIGTRAKTVHSTIYLPNRHKVEVLERQLKDRKDAREAMTLGRLSGLYPNMPLEQAQRQVVKDIITITNELEDAYDNGNTTPTFSLNVESDVRNKRLVIIDEASMVDERMAADIMSFNIPVLAIGDKGQLPPIQGSWGFLSDHSDFMLSEIHRQAADNPIIWLATKARQGEDLPMGRHGDTVNVVRRSKDTATYDMDRELQVICGTHKRRWTLTNNIRKEAGYTCEGPEEGEPLLICKNSKKDPTLINGDFCISAQDVPVLVKGRAGFPLNIIQEDGMEKSIFVYQGLFEQHKLRRKNGATADQRQAFKTQATAENVDFAHAITCHKSQGSQWDEVVLHDEGGVFGDDARRWRYTGITRAAERLTIVI